MGCRRRNVPTISDQPHMPTATSRSSGRERPRLRQAAGRALAARLNARSGHVAPVD